MVRKEKTGIDKKKKGGRGGGGHVTDKKCIIYCWCRL